jgi:ribosomal protein S18 acetylase RimI-like enzyme
MRLVSLHDRPVIAALLERDAPLHLYALGDLDDFFWPATLWYGLEVDGALRQVLLGYLAEARLVLHALSAGPPEELQALLRLAQPFLPAQIYAHMTPGAEAALAGHYAMDYHGRHHKLLLDPSAFAAVDDAAVTALDAADLADMLALYAASYPGNWFDARMLATGLYRGLRIDGQLVSIAGVHVHAPDRGIAVLGNIVTHPAHRGHGLATRVTARLCRDLLPQTRWIGLNVRADNHAALACYRRLGFAYAAEYDEISLTLRR